MEIDIWIKSLIKGFRERYQNLSKDVQKGISNLHNFVPPCQVNIIWIQNRQFNIDYQIFLFTKWEDRKDLEVIIHGPIDSKNAKKALLQFLQDKKWTKKYLTKARPRRKEREQTYSDRIANIFSRAFQSMERHVVDFFFRPEKSLSPLLSTKGGIANKDFYWFCVGKAQELDINSMINDFIYDVRQRAKLPSKKIVKEVKEFLRGYGTFFYPPIWIGNIPKLSNEEKLFGRPMYVYAGHCFETIYNKRILTITKDGFISICEDKKEVAIELLNQIMATALFFNMETRSIRQFEIFDNEIDSQKHNIVRFTISPISLRAKLIEERIKILVPSSIQYARSIVSKKKIINVIKKSEIISQNEEINNFLKFILESYTHYKNSEYSQSFIMSWLILENSIAKEWIQLLDKKGVHGDRRKKLKNRSSWPLDHLIETLNLGNKVKNDRYNLLIKLKKIRNGIVHKGKKCSKDNAKRCLDLSIKKVRAMINCVLKDSKT